MRMHTKHRCLLGDLLLIDSLEVVEVPDRMNSFANFLDNCLVFGEFCLTE